MADRTSSLGSFQDHTREAPNLLRLFRASLQQLRVPRDGLQDVIEIVRNAAGELAQRDHSFRMSRPRLRSFTCRDLPLDLRLRQKVAEEQKSDPVQIDDDDR